MSMLLTAQAMKLKIGNPARKLVLLKLADNANDDGVCFPSYKNIAEHCEISERSAISHINALIEMGLVSKKRRKTENGDTSNLYILHLAGGENIAPQGVKNFHSGGENHDTQGVKNFHPEPINITNQLTSITPLNPPKGSEGENEPETIVAENLRTPNLASAKNTQPNTELADNFHAFWQAGLPKLNRAKAEQAFKRAFEAWRKNEKNRGQGLVEFTEMLIADIRKRNGLGQFGFDKLHPTTYLNGKRWEDDYPQPSATPQNGVSPNAVHSMGWSAGIFDPFNEGEW